MAKRKVEQDAGTEKAEAGGKKAGKVVVGVLTDWPIGARLAKLLQLPASATALGCFHAVGPHARAVAALVRSAPEAPSDEIKAAADRIHAALAVCAADKAVTGFHGSLSADELRALLGATYEIITPAAAAAARKKPATQSLRKIEAALQTVDGLPKKRVLAWLEKPGAKFIDADADQLAKVFVADPEYMNEVDDRLVALWCHNVAVTSRAFPMPPGDREMGFDRRSFWVDRLVAAGVAPEIVEERVLTRWAEYMRMRPSTGLWVWEQLTADPKAWSRRVLDLEDGALSLAKVLSAMLELPRAALAAGALAELQRFCADASLVPNETMTKLMKDPDYEPLLAPVVRRGKSAKFRAFPSGKIEVGVPLRDVKVV